MCEKRVAVPLFFLAKSMAKTNKASQRQTKFMQFYLVTAGSGSLSLLPQTNCSNNSLTDQHLNSTYCKSLNVYTNRKTLSLSEMTRTFFNLMASAFDS